MTNPFVLTQYISPAYFCDREAETARLLANIENGRNTVVYSLRRLGKTQLVQHLFHKLREKREVLPVYFDIFHTRDLDQFTLAFADAVFRSLSTDSTSMLEKATKILSNLRVTLSIDPFTGSPTLQLDIKSPRESEITLRRIFEHISAQKQQVIVAIDEFQQVAGYPGGSAEAMLRSFMAGCPNIRFIFLGSVKHLLVSMFASESSPFYQSAEMMKLGKIETEVYTRFVRRLFREKGSEIPEEITSEIIKWCRNHTYFVQRFFNKLYTIPGETVGEDEVKTVLRELLLENEPVFNDYRRFYTRFQWDLLSAIARENGAKNIYSSAFISKYGLGSASSIRTAMQSLLKRDSIHEEGGKIFVTDVFFSRWLEYRGR